MSLKKILMNLISFSPQKIKCQINFQHNRFKTKQYLNYYNPSPETLEILYLFNLFIKMKKNVISLYIL